MSMSYIKDEIRINAATDRDKSVISDSRIRNFSCVAYRTLGTLGLSANFTG
jgi:hypothetical protein